MLTVDTILDTDEVAKQLRCSAEQAEELLRSGQLAGTKIGRGWVTTYSELIEFLRERIRKAKPAPAQPTAVQPAGKKGPRALPSLPDIRR